MSTVIIQHIRDHAGLHAKLAAERAHIAELEAMGVHRAAEAAHLTAEAARLRAEIDSANAAALRLSAESDRRAGMISRMQGSASWKITSPLRALRRVCFGGKRGPQAAAGRQQAAPTPPEPAILAPVAGPGLTIAARSDYKRVRDKQSVDADSAKCAVAGYNAEAMLLRTARRTEVILGITTGLCAGDGMLDIDIQHIRYHVGLHAQLAAARARIAELEAMGVHRAAEVAHRAAGAARLRAELDSANAAALRLSAESDRRAGKILRMQASASWKITSPLRALRRVCFDGKRGPQAAAGQQQAAPTPPEPAILAPVADPGQQQAAPTPPEPAILAPVADLGLTIAARSDYKRVWDRQSVDADSAKCAVAGYNDEAMLLCTARRTEEILGLTTGLRAEDVMLEIGCGVGRVGSVLAPRCRHWIGADISGNMIAHARERMAAHPNVTFVELSTVGLVEIPDASVDVVYCTVVFMHLYEWDRWQYVKEAFRVLRPGGRCYFDNVAIGSEHGWQMLIAGAACPLDRRPAHLSMISSGEELETYATRAGFGDVRVHRFPEGWVAVSGSKP